MDCYLSGTADYCETAFWASEWLVTNENGRAWNAEKYVKIEDCGRLTDIGGYPDYYQVAEGNIIRVVDLKSFSDGSKDYFAQLAGCALAIATSRKISLETSCELTVLHGLTKRPETRWYTVIECLYIAKDIYASRYDNGNVHTICDACQYCARATDGTCNAQGAIVEATKVDMAITFPVSQEQLIASPATAAQVAIIAKAGVKFWERQFEMCKESARKNNGVIDDGKGCKFAFKTVNGKHTCKDLLALVANLNGLGISNEKIIEKTDISLTSLRKLMAGLPGETVKEIENEFFTSDSMIEKFERITK
jgi:hypothetical protein